jgi:hypothetical protein
VWIGPTAFGNLTRLRYVVLHELGHAWQYHTGASPSSSPTTSSGAGPPRARPWKPAATASPPCGAPPTTTTGCAPPPPSRRQPGGWPATGPDGLGLKEGSTSPRPPDRVRRPRSTP